MCFLIQGVNDLRKLQEIAKSNLNLSVNAGEFSKFRHLQENKNAVTKKMGQDGLVYPNYFTMGLVNGRSQESGSIEIVPMRYRIRRSFNQEEIPSRFNVFNARSDSLFQKETWRDLVGKNHGLFVAKSFFEWVIRDGKKQLVEFKPTKSEYFFAPTLFDIYTNVKTNERFYSFAVITKDPPPEVLENGHDRCPVHLSENYLNSWLEASPSEALSVLDHISDEKFECLLRSELQKSSMSGEVKSNQLNLFK